MLINNEIDNSLLLEKFNLLMQASIDINRCINDDDYLCKMLNDSDLNNIKKLKRKIIRDQLSI